MSADLTLTDRQHRELVQAVRHIGRAMRALDRAKVPNPPRIGVCPEWLINLYDGEDMLRAASDRLIDGLEAFDGLA